MPRKQGYNKVLGKQFRIKGKTTTKKGKREYMRKYMRLYRQKQKRKRARKRSK